MALPTRRLAAIDNPFSAHRIRPGQIPYLFSHEDQTTDQSRLDDLIEAWRANGYIGQIVGAHGCGKTTLAQAIAIRAAESPIHPFDSVTSLTIRAKSLNRIRSPWSWLPRLLLLRPIEVSVGQAIFPEGANRTVDSRSTKNVRLIDGIERLTSIQQAAVFHSVKRQHIPTLFTTHRVSRRLRLLGNACPVLFHATSDMRMFAKIVSLMMETCDPLEQAVVEDAFRSCHGNVREALMKLYDAFEFEAHSSR